MGKFQKKKKGGPPKVSQSSKEVLKAHHPRIILNSLNKVHKKEKSKKEYPQAEAKQSNLLDFEDMMEMPEANGS